MNQIYQCGYTFIRFILVYKTGVLRLETVYWLCRQFTGYAELGTVNIHAEIQLFNYQCFTIKFVKS